MSYRRLALRRSRAPWIRERPITRITKKAITPKQKKAQVLSEALARQSLAVGGQGHRGGDEHRRQCCQEDRGGALHGRQSIATRSVGSRARRGRRGVAF